MARKIQIGDKVRYRNPKNLGGEVDEIDYATGKIHFVTARGGGYSCYIHQVELGEPVFFTGPVLETKQ